MKESKLFGIYAHPVHHSMSPLMHNTAFSYLELPYYYQAFDIPPEAIEQAIEAMRILHIGGVNVSIPLKEKVLPLLDEVDAEARLIGAVNTIVREENGLLKGYNTDGAGYVQSLIAETGIVLSSTTALIFGAGGAAKGIAVYLLKQGCSRIFVSNRNQEKAIKLVRQLEAYIAENTLLGKVEALPWESVEEKLPAFSLLINTTPVGMWPKVEETPIQLELLAQNTIVSDIVYNPLKTAFLAEAERKGAKIHTGLGMFIYQGALAFELFTGQKAPIKQMKEAVLNHLQQGG